MDSFFGSAVSRLTLKAPAKRPEHSRRQVVHDQYYSRRTLGMAFLRQAVILPPGEEREDWLATNLLDFLEALTLLVRIVQDKDCRPSLDPGWGFPPGFEYLWVDPTTRKPIKCAGPDYIEHVLTWVEGVVGDKRQFPALPSGPSGSGSGGSYPRDFEKTVKAVFKRFFRIFAILYTHHYQAVEGMGAVAHLNTTFKHFLFFSFEFDLIPQQELEAIDVLVVRMRDEYYKQDGHILHVADGSVDLALVTMTSSSCPITPSSVVRAGR